MTTFKPTQQLTELDPEIDLVAVERPGSDTLRLFIDHPGGVDLALCERVTQHLERPRAPTTRLRFPRPGTKYRRANHRSRDQGAAPVSKEIVEAVKALEQEKGISAEKLMDALEDALLSAYKKTPGAAKYARVDLDHETGDFRVFELILPPELEEKLLAEAAEPRRRSGNRSGDGRAARARGPRARPGDDRSLRGPDHDPRRHP